MYLGVILYTVHIFFVGRPRGISGTAYQPFWTRLFPDELGQARSLSGSSWQISWSRVW